MDNREKILTQALSLFASRGYEAVGIQEIVDACHITKPTLYHYFGSKKGLLEAILESGGQPLLLTVDKAAAYQRDITANLNNLVLAFFAFARDHVTFYRLLLSHAFYPKENEIYPSISRIHQELYQRLETLFQAAAQDHGNMRGRSRAYAVTFLGMVNTYISLSVLEERIPLSPQLPYQAVHQFMHGVFS